MSRKSYLKGFPEPGANAKTIVNWIQNLKFPECSDDKAKTKKEMEQMLKDAKTAADRIPANDKESQEAVAPYLKKIETFKVDELPPCTVIHTDGFTGLPKPITSDEDIKKIVEWIDGLVPKLPTCSDDKEKTRQEIEQMLKDVGDAIGYIQQASQVDKFSKKAMAELKGLEDTKKKIQDFLDNKLKGLPPCKKGDILKGPKFIFHGFGYYSRPGSDQTYAVTFVDSGENCTFGRSEPISMPLTATDVSFNPVPSDVVPPSGGTPTDTPKTPVTDVPSSTPIPPTTDKPTVSDTSKTPTDTPQTPPDKPTTTTNTPPPEQPKTPEQPPTMAEKLPSEPPPNTPPTTTTEATPTDDVVILFKGDQAVLERGQTGDPLKGEHLMLVFKTPDLRESGTDKPATDDSGFDKDGVQAVTGADGQAKLRVPAEDRALYLSSLGDKPKKYYRIDADALKNTGSVSEIAPNAKPDLTGGAPRGGNVAAEVIKIGDRIFVRWLYVAPFGVNVVLLSGQKVDWCRVVEPGPALGMEPEYPSALHRELPEATVKLPQSRRLGRYAP